MTLKISTPKELGASFFGPNTNCCKYKFGTQLCGCGNNSCGLDAKLLLQNREDTSVIEKRLSTDPSFSRVEQQYPNFQQLTRPQSHIGTGRTTRMLQEAVYEAVVNGRAVYVVCLSPQHVEYLKSKLGDSRVILGIKFETLSTLSNYDLETGRLQGGHPNCKVFVDHSVIEQYLLDMDTRLARLRNEVNRYNKGE